MMKLKIVSILILSIALNFSIHAQTYFTKTGTIKFESKTKLEDIKAENRKVLSVLNTSTGALSFTLLMKAFDFPNKIMQDHFNESYAESDLYPKASFAGSISNIKQIDFTKNGTYTANFTGQLTIKNVTKTISDQATIVVKDGKIAATSKIKVKPADYNFKIPAPVVGKIADELDVFIQLNYEPKK